MTHLTPVPSDPDELKAWLVEHVGNDPRQLLSTLVSAGSLPMQAFGNSEIALPDPPGEPTLLTVKVSLNGAKPPVWRRLQVRGDLTLAEVHDVLQKSMGWLDCHLHRFYPDTDECGGYFVTEFDLDEGDEGTPEDTVRLDQLLRAPGDRIRYEYDFGDGWSHDLTLEKVSPLAPGPPRCLGGARACPPEDVGGVHAHNELVAWFAAGEPANDVPSPFDDAEHVHDWLPLDYDPAAFGVEDVNAALAQECVAAAARSRFHPDLQQALDGLDPIGQYLVDQALADLPTDEPTAEQLTAGVRHWRALLEAIGDGVKLTDAGYLPPAVVEQVFRDLHLEEAWIGKGNREDLTPPVARLRDEAQRLGLLRKAKGTVAPTAAATRVGTDDRRLWEFVRLRLPLGKDAEADAGWFGLLLLAAGRSGQDRRRGVADLLTSRGWRLRGGDRPSDWDAYDLCRATVHAVTGPDRSLRDEDDPPWAAPLAAAVLRGLG